MAQAITNTPECRLVVVDPITAYLGKTDSHKNAEIRGLLAPLAALAFQHHIAVVEVTHLRKGDGAAIYRAMGSLAFIAAAWAVAKDDDDPTGRRRLFLPLKNNLAKEQSGLAYELRDSGAGMASVIWEADPVNRSADEVLSNHAKPGPQPDEQDESEEMVA